MGCSASRPDQTLLFPSSSSSFSNPNPETTDRISRTLSLPTKPPLVVHHPPLKKGDTHHLVSLTSTTYGSLLLIDPKNNKPNSKFDHNPNLSSSPDSVINTWELMADLDSSSSDCSDLRKQSSSSASASSVVLLDRSLSASTATTTTKKCNSFDRFDGFGKVGCNPIDGKVKKLCNSFEASSLDNNNNNHHKSSPSNLTTTRPLWKHLAEESLLADMDPNVATSFRRAVSAKQLGFNNNNSSSKTATMMMTRTSSTMSGSSRLSSPFVNDKIRLRGTEDRIVVYFTSLRGIRRTYEDCCAVRAIFRGFRVSVDERDISMDSAYRKELLSALDEKTVTLPRVFIRGRYIGGAEEIKQLNEVGELAKLLEGFPVRDIRLVCDICGDARFVPCTNCNGSRKIFLEEEEQLRRCPECNENGLIRCPTCCY